MGKEMTSITNKTAQQVCEMYPASGNKNVLKELFEAVMEQMRRIVAAHTIVLNSVKELLKDQQYNHDIALYSQEDVWSQVQTVVRLTSSKLHSLNNLQTFIISRFKCCFLNIGTWVNLHRAIITLPVAFHPVTLRWRRAI